MNRRLALDPVVRQISCRLPGPFVVSWARWALGNREAALCLHRVCDVGALHDAEPSLLVIPAATLKDLLYHAERIGRGRQWLTLSFDDGYPDAVQYVSSHAEDHPLIRWRLFVCPDKALRQRGFRWDAGLDPLGGLPATVTALDAENDRPELIAAGVQGTTAVADMDTLRDLQRRLPEVLGNHTNSHLPMASFAPEIAAHELARSIAVFEHELGPCRSFAFPFGTPGVYWRPEHAEQLFDAGVSELWSVQSRTFGADDRDQGAVLPRFPVDGRDSAVTILALVAARATLERVRRPARAKTPLSPTVRRALAAPEIGAHGYVQGEALVHLGGPLAGPKSAIPFVLMHGASGHVENFRPLVTLLGPNTPVYGIRALGLLAGEDPAETFDELVGTAISAVKQLGRPVRLAGYSLGGVISLQMSIALHAAGLIDGPVMLIDTYAHHLELLPLRKRIVHAQQFARHNGVWSVKAWVARLIQRQLRGALRRPAPAQPWREELGFGETSQLGFAAIEPHIRSLCADYSTLDPFDGPVRCIRSHEMAPNLPLDAGIGHLMVRQPEVLLVPGDHFSMFAPVNVERLAGALVRQLHWM